MFRNKKKISRIIVFVLLFQLFGSFGSDGSVLLANGDSEGDSTVIEAVYEQDLKAPSIPLNLRIDQVDHQSAVISWDASSDDAGVDHYVIYRNGLQVNTVSGGSTQYSDSGLRADSVYYYSVSAVDTLDNASELSNQLIVITSVSPLNGKGLKAEYFNGTDFNELRTVRLDETVNFDWGDGAPLSTLDKNSFSVRWSGKVLPEFSEDYTFYTETHGGVRLWVNNQLLFDAWNAKNGMVKEKATIKLNAGQLHAMRLEFKEDKGAAEARLFWSSASQPKEIIPQVRLVAPNIPDVPTNVHVTELSHAISLKWDEVEGAKGYEVEADGTLVYHGENNAFTHLPLEPNSIHLYRIRAFVPEIAGNWSAPIFSTTKIGVPTNLTTEVSTDQISLAWDQVEGATRYEVEADGIVIDNSNSTSFIHSALMPNTEHTYRVRAISATSIGDWSALISKTVLSEVPTNIRFSTTSVDISMSWDAVPGAVGYDVEADDAMIEMEAISTYIHANLNPNTRHTYRIRARFENKVGEWSPSFIKATLPLPGSGTGLKGEYFDGDNLFGFQAARIDDTINFDWNNRSPAEGINDKDFSARWTGQIEARYSENYNFTLEAHGGTRLWVDGKILIDDWSAHSDHVQTGSIALEAGERYDIQIEYREANGSARVHLYWNSESQVKEIVPRNQLYPIGVARNLATTSEFTRIVLTWEPVTFAERYDIEVDGNVIDNGIGSIFTHDNLTPGTMHAYRVRARNGIVVGEWSSVITEITKLGSSTITELSANETSVTVSWTAVDGATSYDIEADGTWINNGNNTTFTHENLAPGTNHSYRVRSRTNVATGELSEYAYKWTLPDIPGNIQTSSTSDSITLQWDDVIGATAYDVEVNNTILDNGGSTSYTETGLSSNSQRTYRVRAKNSSGVGKWSPIIAEVTLPGSPTLLQGTATDKTILVTWEPSAGATSYDLSANGQMITDLTETQFLHEFLVSNTQYTYKVRAKNNKGASEWSEIIEVTTLPSVPKNIKLEATSKEIVVMWDRVSGATGYDIEVDGRVVDNSDSNRFVHNGIAANSEHVYRVRAKNGSILGYWSDPITKMTAPETPQGLKAISEINEVLLTWESVIGSTGYELEADGTIVQIGSATEYMHEGLTPNSEHAYRVRALNAGGPGQWSNSISVLTKMDVPSNLRATSTSDSITLVWDPVENITGYDVMVDGEIVDNKLLTSFEHTDLEPFTIHVYRVRARAGERTGDWSEAFSQATMLGTPANVQTSASSSQILVSWDEVSGATAYEIEIDGETIQEVSDPNYSHQGLEANSEHSYRIRAKNDLVFSEWTEVITQLTTPSIPENLAAEAKVNSISLRWNAVSGAESYDIEVDGEVVNVKEPVYVHDKLKPNTMHVYRVRANNKGGSSLWTELLQKTTTPAIEVNAGIDTMFNFVFVAPQKPGVNQRIITVTYNPDEVEVLDLIANTPKAELETGKIAGTNITVLQFEAGKIVYLIENANKTVMNSIRFMAKTSENSEITYVVE